MTNAAAVVVVDDDVDMRRSIEQILDLRGFSTRSFASAEQFLNDENGAKANCVIVDINLGGISGIELCRRLRASGAKIPVIFMTASEDTATAFRATEAGCIAFLRKPFTGCALLDAISKAQLTGNSSERGWLQ